MGLQMFPENRYWWYLY